MEEGFEQNKGRKKEKGNRPGQIGKRRGEREKKIRKRRNEAETLSNCDRNRFLHRSSFALHFSFG